ncbi:OmpA family protein [Geobacter sp. DSM 9736]|uniref:OmpA family protein n=1 Tax=Geobacter sp. DSM 9736 TaxID=1277350 RepID=UPI000B50636B|nr:OmpA family protein [Geobacter sp. DSM 9736]SNB45419.1 Outer membrane protein OmpA [Geobacter sp. DSM 9736]
MPGKPIAAVLMLLLPATVNAAEIRQRPFEYSFEVAKAQTDDVFAICSNCPDDHISALPAPPQLALRFGQKAEPTETPIRTAAVREVSKPGATLLGTIHFQLDSAVLPGTERSKLEEVISSIPAGTAVNIDGYTCNLGSAAHNLRLSFSRARRVAGYLESKGVRVRKVRGLGKCCAVSDDRRLNRRVEITAREKEGE